ncbi:MAG: ornithine cyclodeaminase family protein [Desulfobacterota bacterium]|nr:ornithine cyclodeaminase family protein [Thermodesulfobacteriota bacterium]
MLILDKKDLEELLPMEEVIEVLRAGFREVKEGRCVVPVRFHLAVGEYQGQFLFMPAYLSGLKQAGTKIVSVFPQNVSRGKPTIYATYLLCDPTTGELLAVMEGATLTGIRTGAASGLATGYLARKEAKALGVIGTGFQSYFQVRAIQAVRSIEEIWAYDTDPNRLREFCERFSPFVKVHPVSSASEVVRPSDILITSTTSTTPVFSGRDLKPGTHINAIGAFRPDMRETDDETVLRAKIVVDTYEGCLSEAGDLLIPMAEGKLKKEAIHGDLGDLVTGRKKGRETEEEITLFKSVGFAMEDVVTASHAYEKAGRSGMGKRIELL